MSRETEGGNGSGGGSGPLDTSNGETRNDILRKHREANNRNITTAPGLRKSGTGTRRKLNAGLANGAVLHFPTTRRISETGENS